MGRLVTWFVCLLPLHVFAQFTYTFDQGVPVTSDDDTPLSLPWTGGLNAAQYNALDIDGDGDNDLVLFDRMANKVITYVNTNNQYLYAPEFEALFPGDITNWILLRDFNCDGKKDIFTGDVLGIKVYTNETQPGGTLTWKRFRFYVGPGLTKSDVLLTKGFSGKINLQLQFDDLPSIADIDGDGDLDILNVKFTGAGSVEFHQNFSQERYGRCDSLDFERITQNYGGITECECGVFAFNNNSCTEPGGGRVEHAGGKALLSIDVDNDQNMDLVFSEASCTRLFLFHNEGTSANPVFTSAQDFPVTDPVNFLLFPAAYYEDVNFDGVKDIISSPNIFSKSVLNTDLRRSNWLYTNNGTDTNPSLSFSSRQFLQDQMIEVGDNAVPAFFDYDGDGDLDMFVGQNLGDNFLASIYLYQNTGTNSDPAFKLATRDFGGLGFFALFNIKPQFADINNDNKVDLVFTATSFAAGTTRVYYFLNNSASALNLGGQDMQELNFSITSSENVHMTDVDLDGLSDLLVGRSNGALEFWRNSNGVFVLEDGAFLGLGSSTLRQSPAIVTGDLDGDGTTDLLLGNQYGELIIYPNYRDAGPTPPVLTDFVYNPVLDTYVGGNMGGRIWPAIANVFNTDRPAIVIGTIMGGVRLLKNEGGSALPDRPMVRLYPNPVAKDQTFNVTIDRFAYMQVYSSLGQELTTPVLLQPNQIFTYSVQQFAAGVYIARFYFDNKTYSTRFVVY